MKSHSSPSTINSPLPAPAMAGAEALMRNLSNEEAHRLLECEGIIQQGLDTFYEVGAALHTIQEGRLYRATDATFDHYCRRRWGMTPRHAQRLSASSVVMRNLLGAGNATHGSHLDAKPPNYDLSGAAQKIDDPGNFLAEGPPRAAAPRVKPTAERQLRPLAGLPANEQGAAWDEAAASAPEGKVPTARQVQAAVDKRKPILVDPARLEEGGDICRARSVERLGDVPAKIAKPFEHDGGLWCVVSIVHCPNPAESRWSACRLIPRHAYFGPKEKKFSYEGREVMWQGYYYNLGPETRFAADLQTNFRLEGEAAPRAGEFSPAHRAQIEGAANKAFRCLKAIGELLAGERRLKEAIIRCLEELEEFRDLWQERKAGRNIEGRKMGAEKQASTQRRRECKVARDREDHQRGPTAATRALLSARAREQWKVRKAKVRKERNVWDLPGGWRVSEESRLKEIRGTKNVLWLKRVVKHGELHGEMHVVKTAAAARLRVLENLRKARQRPSARRTKLDMIAGG